MEFKISNYGAQSTSKNKKIENMFDKYLDARQGICYYIAGG